MSWSGVAWAVSGLALGTALWAWFRAARLRHMREAYWETRAQFEAAGFKFDGRGKIVGKAKR